MAPALDGFVFLPSLSRKRAEIRPTQSKTRGEKESVAKEFTHLVSSTDGTAKAKASGVVICLPRRASPETDLLLKKRTPSQMEEPLTAKPRSSRFGGGHLCFAIYGKTLSMKTRRVCGCWKTTEDEVQGQASPRQVPNLAHPIPVPNAKKQPKEKRGGDFGTRKEETKRIPGS